MTDSPSNPKSRGLEPPLRRVLAVDAGARCIRLLLLESRFGKVRVLRQDVLDLQQEGLVAAEELQAHLQKVLAQWGRPPIALVLPQAVAVSQIVDLPPVPEHEACKLIEDETIKLAGVSGSALVSDFVRVAPQTDGRQSFWVTFCQEGEIHSRIAQLGLDREDFREITTAANALLTAWLAATSPKSKVQGLKSKVQSPKPTLDFGPQTLDSNAVLVHAGAQATTLVVIRAGTAVFASSFPMGGDFFTRAIARLRRCPPEAAEAAKVSTPLITGPEALPGFAEIVDGWAAEVKRQLAEWRAANPRTAADPGNYEFIATGGVFDQPGLLEHLATQSGLKFHRWPVPDATESPSPQPGFELAFGAALQALGRSPQPASLLPAARRAAWKRRLGRQQLEFANALLLALCFLALSFGIWRKVSLIQHKQELLAKVQAGLETAQASAALAADLQNSYDAVRPLFEREQHTADTLRTLALLQQARSNHAAWFVLLADQPTYFSYPATLATNRPGVTAADEMENGRYRESTNVSPARPGLIAELCVPGNADAARNTLGLMVNTLKREPVFARVDLLSEDLRRSLADPKVLVRDRHFALALDFATTEFQAPLAGRRIRGGGAGRPVFPSFLPLPPAGGTNPPATAP